MKFKAFPVAVVVDDVVHEPALLWATAGRTEVWVTGPNSRTPVLLATYAETVNRGRVVGEFLPGTERKAKFAAELADGTRLLVAQAPGCGCGHPLKSFRPAEAASA